MLDQVCAMIPARFRKYVYGVLALLAYVVAAIQTYNGDWKLAVPALIVGLVNTMAHNRTDTGTSTQPSDPKPDQAPPTE